jgi:hypothetical protein
MRWVFLLTILGGCATLPECYKIEDIIEKTKCEENEKQRNYYQNTGWRYDVGRDFR